MARKQATSKARGPPQLTETSYTSVPVSIAEDFLSCNSTETPTVTSSKINFAEANLPEYTGCDAFVLENVLTAAECRQLRRYAEQSTGSVDTDTDADASQSGGSSAWKPAMLNGGLGLEYLATEYRNSDRIVWDQDALVARIWDRCLLADGLEPQLRTLEGDEVVLGPKAVEKQQRWNLSRANGRMRFLKYGKGQYFKEHVDSSYENPDSKVRERSLYTLHLYLNDSVAKLGKGEDGGNPADLKPEELEQKDVCSGGATRFHALGDDRHKRYLDVNPKSGRVLIFQQRRLLHSGAEVFAGFKYTMRTDLMYEFELLTPEGG
ncbi:MAG: hypothetical protein M1818_007425 [Claussenomyces sp. TS43310]|nr:MAG: hypothetical protein M1818_007425 [Claussenomyces sp. TS43310]